MGVKANSSAGAIKREPVIFWLCAAMMVMIFTVSSPILNLFVPYTQSGGGFIFKFHPASWLALPLAFLVWQDRAVAKGLSARHLLLGAGFLVILIVWLAMRRKGALAATFIDIHLTPVILLLALTRLSMARVRSLLLVFIGFAAVNVVLVFIEFVSQSALLPREGYERFFRPAGFFVHPIMSATLFYCAMFLSSRGVVSSHLVRPLLLLFLAGIALSGVRGPLAMGLLIFLWHVFFPVIPRRSSSDYILDFGAVALLPIGAIAALAFGAFDRILQLGIWEESAQSRFLIFGALELLTDREFWVGVSSYDAGELLATQATGNRLIENAFVSTIFQAGFPAAFMLGVVLLILHAPAMRRSLVFMAMIFLVALTTLGFGTKNMIAAAVGVTGYWVWRRAIERKRPAGMSRLSTGGNDAVA